MKSIFFLIETIYQNQFRYYFLRNKTLFPDFSLHFRKTNWILNISKKGWPLELKYFQNDGHRERWLDKCLKSPVSDDPLTSNISKGPKHCWFLKDSIFTTFIDHCQSNWVEKGLFWCYGKSQDCLLTHWLPMTSILFLKETI